MDEGVHWQFEKGTASRWTWSYVDPTTGNVTKCSLSSFASLVDCKNDAAQHGYKYATQSAPGQPSSRKAAPSSTRNTK